MCVCVRVCVCVSVCVCVCVCVCVSVSVSHLVDLHAETRKSRMQDTGHSDIGHLLGFSSRVSRAIRLRV